MKRKSKDPHARFIAAAVSFREALIAMGKGPAKGDAIYCNKCAKRVKGLSK